MRQVERVVLNALANKCGFRRWILAHRETPAIVFSLVAEAAARRGEADPPADSQAAISCCAKHSVCADSEEQPQPCTALRPMYFIDFIEPRLPWA
jgi:hypothetical protein